MKNLCPVARLSTYPMVAVLRCLESFGSTVLLEVSGHYSDRFEGEIAYLAGGLLESR